MTIATTTQIVHAKRQEVEQAKKYLASTRIELELSDQFQATADAEKELAFARADLETAEDALRGEAIERYNFTGEKKYPGIEIKLTTRLTYPEQVARDYCREHLPNALKLDRVGFEKVAKVLSLNFVTITQKPKAYIASDLSEVVEGAR